MAVLLSRKTQGFLLVLILLLSSVFVVHAESSKDPFLSELWYLKAMHVPKVAQTGHVSVVAILDAGFDLDHEDLMNQYWTNTDETAGDHKDNDRNGFEDDVHGWDFVDDDPNPVPDISDENTDDTIASHGTLLAGLIAATANNGKGITGIAPNAKIMPLRILDAHGKGTTAQVRDAITYAVKNGADVINLSFASHKPDDQLQQVIAWAVDQGVVVVAAVGNDSVNVDRDPTFPACFDTRIGTNRVIGVAALDQTGKKAVFSNDGSNCVDVAAPGTDIFGAVYHDASNIFYSTAYGSPFEGTSIAAPMVTGAVALLKSQYPTLTPNQIRLALMLSADPILAESSDARNRLGAGLVHVERALQIAPQFVGVVSVSDKTNQHPSGSMVIAQGAGSEPLVKRFDASGKELNAFLAYDKKFRGGVRVAAGDVNGDGTEEIITVPASRGGPHVRVFDVNGKLLHQFFALNPSDRNGLIVTTGDVNGDGAEEILITQASGGNGQVRMFRKTGEMIGSFYPFERTTLPVFVSVGNFDDDAEKEIVASLGGTDKKNHVKIFDANGLFVRDFSVFAKRSSGIRVATIHTKQQVKDQILVSLESGTSPWVGIYDAYGTSVSSGLVFPETFMGGVAVAAGDLNKNGSVEMIAVPVSRGGPHVRFFDPVFKGLGSFFAFEKSTRYGLSIAIWNP